MMLCLKPYVASTLGVFTMISILAINGKHMLMLSGQCRTNMHAIEITIQNLIGSGMDPKTENNPYLGFIYTSFQERATKVLPADVWPIASGVRYFFSSNHSNSAGGRVVPG